MERETKTVAITTGKPKLFSTLPETSAEEAVIKRARQLTEVVWSPVGVIPTRKSSVMQAFKVYFENEYGIWSHLLIEIK